MQHGRPSPDDRHFFSIQPFWSMQLQERHIWNDPRFDFLGQLMLYHNDGKSLDSIPGIGLVGIVFSCDAQNPAAVCYGVLKDRRTALSMEITNGIFVRFSPGEFTRLFGVPSNELPADGIALEELIGKTSIVERMSLSRDWPTRHLLLCELLFKQQCRQKDQELAITRQTIDLVQNSGGNIRIKELERELLYSARYLQNVVQRQIGMSPKQLCDQVRLQNAIRMMRSSHPPEAAQLSQMLGFCDQSHFIRTFKEFVGMSPNSFAKATRSSIE